MKNSIQIIKPIASKALFIIYGINKFKINFKYTKKEFIGDITWIIFPIFKIIQESSKIIGEKLGNYIMKESKIINSFNLIEGYLNLKCKKKYYINFFKKIKYKNFSFFLKKKKNKKKLIMIEYSSPNANKPLHLGHIRNNLLGNSIANIFKYIGYKVIRTQIINDRGIHICKSMVTWKKYSNGDTPENTGIKGDHFVGKYYIKFDKIYNKEKKKNIKIPIMESAKKMLKKWESGDKIILNIWKKMNKWVYKGFKDTYNSLGIKFDETQYESKTYIFGKKIIKKGLIKGIFYKKKDGSIWVDLSNKGLDKKLLLRSDGTSLYITQDIGTVIERFKKYFFNKLIYVVGEEQNYHFKVLFSILKLLKYSWEKNLFHLSYGMVDLPNGKKMQSRKGTVVNADYLIKKMHKKSKKIILKSNKFSKFSKKKKKKISKIIGIGALKYFILKIDPKKKILFDPKSSIDFKGHTGPYIQYTYVRIKSLKKKSSSLIFDYNKNIYISNYEINIIKTIEKYPFIIKNTVKNLDPSLLANYSYELAKNFNDFYQNLDIIRLDNISKQSSFRLDLSFITAKILKLSMNLLGISMPKKM